MKHKSRDFVSDYEKIRGMLRDIFIYGCFNVDDFSEKGISASKYNQDIRKILDIVDGDKIAYQRIKQKKAYYFRINMFEATYNVLFDTFLIKSFTDQEIRLSLKLLQIFSARNQPMTQKEIQVVLDQVEEDEAAELPEVYISDSSLNRRLQALVKSGYLQKTKKRVCDYALAEDIFSDLTEEEINQLIRGVEFMRHLLYPSVCGNFLYDTLKRYQFNKWKGADKESIFLFKHNHFAHVLDDEVLWKLLEALHHKETVSFKFNDNNQVVNYNRVRPMAVYADEKYGRRYLMGGIDAAKQQTKIFRLDKISAVKTVKGDSHWDQEKLNELVRQQTRHSLTGGCDRFNRKPVKVVLQVKKSVVKRIEVEARDLLVTVAPLNGKTTQLELAVNDPMELKPWLRQYTGMVTVEASPEHQLRETMAEELAVWRECYGII